MKSGWEMACKKEFVGKNTSEKEYVWRREKDHHKQIGGGGCRILTVWNELTSPKSLQEDVVDRGELRPPWPPGLAEGGCAVCDLCVWPLHHVHQAVVVPVVVGHTQGQGHVHLLADPSISLWRHGSLLLAVVDAGDLGLAHHALLASHSDEEVGALLHRLDAEGETLGVGVGPEEAIVVVERVATECQPLAVAHADRLQGLGLVVVEEPLRPSTADFVPEAWAHSLVNVDTWNIVSALTNTI